MCLILTPRPALSLLPLQQPPPSVRSFVCSFSHRPSSPLTMHASARRFVAMTHTPTLERIASTGPLNYAPKVAGSQILQSNPTLLTREENRKQVLKMYRKIVRSVPRILLAYEVTGGPMLERQVIGNLRHHFERNKDVTDPGVTAVLRHKAEMEVTESLLMWKTKSHVCNLILNESAPPIAALMAREQQEKQLPAKQAQSPFLSSFYQG